ncbi:ubiquitin-conjugating enzyme E2-binding protein [Aspergillus californicus]
MDPHTDLDHSPQLSSVYISLHAEYLPNIRQVSLQISVPANTQPQISLSESRRAVSVSISLSESDGYISETVKLPARVCESAGRVLGARRDANGDRAGVTDNEAGAGREIQTRELSYRMQVDDSELTQTQRSVFEEHMDSFVPWSASDMDPLTKLRCRSCQKILLDRPSELPRPDVDLDNSTDPAMQSPGWVWKDLPSGNWAEMMDFWHCHKPDPEPSEGEQNKVEDENSMVKGYGASNQVLASAGTVLVDVATFLVSSGECNGLKKVSKETGDPPSSEEELVCECGSLIGVEDSIAKGWRLFKTSLSAGFPSSEAGAEVKWTSHPAELIVAAQLLELIERESARRFIIHCGGKDGLLIWVFNPDMRYSNASSEHSIASQRAMKVFFQLTGNVEGLLHPEPGKASPLSLEELRLPDDTYAFLFKALEASNNILPGSARTFQREWRVGILHRLERAKRM